MCGRDSVMAVTGAFRPRTADAFHADAMVADLTVLTECESFSADIPAANACADLYAEMVEARLGGRLLPDHRTVDGRTHLVWRGAGPVEVLLVGHCDTVWPLGTVARWPVSVDGDRITGPGVFDMKAGLVQQLHALACLDDLAGVAVLVTTDEELGSPTSRPLIEELAAGVDAAFVLEASADGALKTARKGVSLYRLHALGRAAHAGLEPESGVSATVELAHQILEIAALGDAAAGTTVTPTLLRAGATTNTVPDAGEVAIDVRAFSAAEQRRVDDALRALAPRLPGARLRLDGGVNRPPLDAGASAVLFELAQEQAALAGLGPLAQVAVGGASDGNFTAGAGAPTLDGLGAVGAGAHAEGEWASVSAMPGRAALLAALIDAVRRRSE